MNCDKVTLCLKIEGELCIVTYEYANKPDAKLEYGMPSCGVCAYGGHAICRNGGWTFPPFPGEYPLLPESLEKRSIEAMETGTPGNRADAAAVALPVQGDGGGDVSKILRSTVRFTESTSDSDNVPRGPLDQVIGMRLNDQCDAKFIAFNKRGTGGLCLLEFDVNSSAIDPEYEFFKRSDGALTLFSYWLNYKQFILLDGWQIRVMDAAQDLTSAEGSPVNFWVVRSPYAKLENVGDMGILRDAAPPVPLAADPTTLLYELPSGYLSIDGVCANHRNLKIFWMENEQKNMAGIVVGTGNSAYIGSASL
ncbi:MAG: hypothetical protein LBJ94_02385 [Puniceicoccales bacterium]|nr:hypothetical protein [Puniceicoccales bacterium]